MIRFSPRALGSRCALLLTLLVLGGHAPTAFTAPPVTTPPNGLRDNTPQVHALIHATIHLMPEKVLERGTLVLRDGLIVAVGAEIEIPPDARVWDLAGKHLYPGFIDAYAELAHDHDAEHAAGAPYWNARVVPQRSASEHLPQDKAEREALRNQGITARLYAPAGDVINGTSTLVTTGDDEPSRAILREEVAQHIRLTVGRGERDNYPNSPMGAVALARQAFYDAAWYREAWRLHAAQRETPRPEHNDALATLAPCLTGEQWVIADAPNEWFLLRADRFAREFGLKLAVVGSGREYRRLDAIAATGRTVILPLNFPAPPSVVPPEAAAQISLSSLMHWDLAPENPARLAAAGVEFAFTTRGLKETKELWPKVREAVERGLAPEIALAALTTTPAKLCGLEDRLGTLEPGKLAHVVVASGDLFASKSKLEQVWIDGKMYRIAREPDYDLRGKWELATKKPSGDKLTLTLSLQREGKLSGTLALPKPKKGQEAPEPIKLEHIGQSGAHLSAALDAEQLGEAGIARLTAIVDFPAEKSATLAGHIVWADGARTEVTAQRIETASETPHDESKEEGEKQPAAEDLPKNASCEVNYPLGAYGVPSQAEQPAAVLFRNATLWTCTEQGVLENASLLVERGKIVAIGQNLAAPQGAVVIDCQGRHLTPGIIDCHSHMATDGGINETGQGITAEVRIGDFIDPDDINIYRQLAGGVTTINILHGSANPIGGQNQVCKLRWGELDEAMKFAGAPPGIKFALGENVKQSNWGDRFTSRYPQTRMGVEQIMRDEFAAARQYAADWKRWNTNKSGLPPRKDLELEAVSEILQGKRWIHCHSYRQDEILALLKLTDEYHIRIGTLQHILEGYKVADEMAKRGVMGSAFSDWWSYKFEVYDAIPYNGAVMHQAGVVVSFNSDDLELARHLNHEAAKAMKYGGVEPVEALKFVTLNPAKQLRIEDRVGSLAPGKDADLAIWSGPPLALTSRCEQTWIDGRKYFDRSTDLERRAASNKLHTELVQKILRSGKAMLSPGELDGQEADLWPRADLFCGHHHGHDHGFDHGHQHE